MNDCRVKQHFTCDGTGEMCDVCGESERACSCELHERDLVPCGGCDGLGFFCVTHQCGSDGRGCGERTEGGNDDG